MFSKRLKMYKLPWILILAVASLQICNGYKVLLVFPFPGKSISMLGDGIARHLLTAGHEVTYVTPFPKSMKSSQKLRELDASPLLNLAPDGMLNLQNILNKEIDLTDRSLAFQKMLEMGTAKFELEPLKALFNDPKEKFDVVIAGWMFMDLDIAMSAIFNCPFIWVSTVDPHWMMLKLVDEVPNPAYNSDMFSSVIPPLTFTQRAQELMTVVKVSAIKYFYFSQMEEELYERLLLPFIKKRWNKSPSLDDLRYNASLILGNSHVSLGHSVRLPQNYINIGGYHIEDEVKPLPEDLKKLLDGSKNGLIYFSMGSNLRSKHLPAQLKRNLLEMFAKQKQTVLWKFEEDLPNRPNNVHIIQWAPQQSILAHPNCILFITHGGLLSTTETIHFGKPIIGIPVFGDQFINVERAVNRGFAKKVELSYNMTEDLEKAIQEILSDPRYAARVKERSIIYHDRPIPPGKELVHWVEHVVKTGGAPHLRSAALNVPWYQKAFLDLVLVVLAILYSVKVLIAKLLAIIFPGKKRKQKKN